MTGFVAPAIPQSVGRCADLYAEVRELRLAMEKEIEPVKKFEAALRDHIINTLSKSDDTGAAGQRYRAQIVSKERISVIDWGIFNSWVRKNDRFDMLQRRVNEKAIKDWREQEQRELPGTEVAFIPDVSITKI